MSERADNVRTNGHRWQGNRRNVSLVGVATVAILLLAACSAAVQAGAGATEDNALPADFEIALYQGGDAVSRDKIKMSELLAQNRPVVLNMWAGLCPPCRLEMPDFQAVHQLYGDQVVILGLDVGPFTGLGTSQDGRALLAELGITYPAGTLSDASVLQAYKLTGMPSTYFIKPSGEVVCQWAGVLTEAQLSRLVNELLGVS